ncbi:MAG: 2-(1,2-epoxy-1,2-dihydrophenyl)acetyl-CoA isomerase PaaG [Gammaproteobacteria bacterium]
MNFHTIILARRDNLLCLTLNRPDKLNSVDAVMREEISLALADASADDTVRAVLLTGAGRGFCAGQDLSERDIRADKASPNLEKSLRDGYNPIIQTLATMPKPIVCAVNGVAAGAGANIALACDFVIAAHSARFIQAFCKIGLVPDCGGTWFLPRLVGLARARSLAMLGDAVDATTAAAWGMIYQCVADDELTAHSEALAARLAQAPTAALGKIKNLLLASGDHSLPAQLALEAKTQDEAGRSADYAEGTQAFLQRRAPAFVGK